MTEAPSTLPCPICATTMTASRHHGAAGYVCEDHGAWLPEKELERALGSARRSSRASRSAIDRARKKGVASGSLWGVWALKSDGRTPSRRERRRKLVNFPKSSDTASDNAALVPEGQRPCPHCAERMRVEARDNIIIDTCDKHGVWLDGDELQGMLNRSRGRSRLQSKRALRRAEEKGKIDGLLWGFWALLR